MVNVLLKLSYDGRKYHGWQVQKNALSVQEVFQGALFKALGHKTDIKACSRTDTGVHAREFCVSFSTYSGIPPDKIVYAVNTFLPGDIAAFDGIEVDNGFHARYSCKGKQYCYEIWNNRIRNPFYDGYALHYWRKIDEVLLSRAAAHFIGRHDFTSFCTQDRRETNDMRRTVTQAEVTREGDKVIFTVAADGFLYNMVRIMTGTLLRVQEGKIKEDEIDGIIEERDRKYAGPTAPACGLFLNKVYY